MRFHSASPTIGSSTIEQSEGYALSASVDSFPVVSGNTLTGNVGNGLEIRGGMLSTVTPIIKRWSNTDVVYVLTGHTTIGSGVTLVIDPGVMVKFAGNKVLGVSGVLKVQGTSLNPVYITSLKDDTVGGDTNGDGNATAPDRGDWGHIAFLDSSVDSENIIQHAVIRYGGYFYSGSREYYDCYQCSYWGAVRFHSASPTIRDNVLAFNRYGIRTESGSLPQVRDNLIFGTSYYGYGAYNNDSTVTVDTRENWWGHPSGPYHPTSNPSGRGDRVGDYINYRPWITSIPATVGVIRPSLGGSVFSADGRTIVVFASDAVTETVVVTYTARVATNLPSDLADAHHTFALEARTLTGRSVAPIAHITIRYTSGDIKDIYDESTLSLYHWDGMEWTGVASTLDITNNVLTTRVPAEGLYALLGQRKYQLYIPSVSKHG